MAIWNWLFGKTNEQSGTAVAEPLASAHSPAAANLKRWSASGEPLRWVQARSGQWGHDDWLALLEQLRSSAYWPLEEDAVGALLEELKQQVK